MNANLRSSASSAACFFCARNDLCYVAKHAEPTWALDAPDCPVPIHNDEFVADRVKYYRAATGPRSLFRLALANDWPLSRRARQRCQRSCGTTGHFLFRFGGRRRLEIPELRAYMD